MIFSSKAAVIYKKQLENGPISNKLLHNETLKLQMTKTAVNIIIRKEEDKRK
jgi:hypothetical protein